MAIAPVSLPRISPDNWANNPALCARYWNLAMSQIETLLNEIIAIPEIEAALGDVEAAAAAANAAAAAANTAAGNAQTSADNAQSSADATTDATSLANSYVTPTNVLTSTSNTTTASVSIATNTRVYGDGTSVSVNSGTILGLALNTLYYIYYHDTTRSGGSVTYIATTTQNDAAQVGDVHTLGSITTPAASSSGAGKVVRPPGVSTL